MTPSLTFTRFIWKNLRRRRLRSLLTLGGIGMAVGAFVALVGFSRSFQQQWMRIYSSSGIDFEVIQGTFLNTSLDESVTGKLKALPMVAHAAPTMFNLMDLTPDMNVLVYGWRADSYEFNSIQFLSGHGFSDGQPQVILGEQLAQDLKKKPGDTLDVQGMPFAVTGIYQGASSLFQDAMIIPLDKLQQLSSLQGKVSTVDVWLRPAPDGESQQDYLKRSKAEIEAALPGLRAIPAVERANDNQFVRLAAASAWGTSTLALLIGILGITNTMVMSVFERTKEIGILRALGWKRWQVLLLIELEAGVMGLGGGFLGIALGWIALRILSILPRTAILVSASVEWPLLVEAMGIGVLAGLIAGALPAWRGGQLAPVDALHHD